MIEVALINSRLVAFVDDADAPRVLAHRWGAWAYKSGDRVFIYAGAVIEGKSVLMHRLILAAPTGLLVDHRNHATLDNRRENLRVCSRSQNQQNRRVNANSTTGVKGVRLDRTCGRYIAEIRVEGKRLHLGRFDDLAAAADAYRTAALKLHGEFACVS
ncbi:HNH endonuclease [Cupriavidus pauculus]|uniref:HNH endonuclease n=1 Tax=Cupriavidus pauculus TaxID=82633 RepID=UPI0038576D51